MKNAAAPFPEFGALLEWHMQRGTRPGGLVDRNGRRWTVESFANATGYSERSIRSWLEGRTIPANIDKIEIALFGESLALAQWRTDFRDVHQYGKVIQQRDRTDGFDVGPLGSTGLSMGSIQVFTSTTPLVEETALVTLSMFLGKHDNHTEPLEVLLNSPRAAYREIRLAADFKDFLWHLVADRKDGRELIQPLVESIDTQHAVLFNGSVNAATSAQLARLPSLLKGFAGLSPKQFRVGLFRLSATIVVVTIVSSVSAYATWFAIRELHNFGADVLAQLSSKSK